MRTSQARPTGQQVLHRVVADGTPDLHTAVSVDGVFRFVSAAGAKLFGWSPRDVLGHPQTAFTHPDDETLVVDAHRRLLDGATSTTTTQRFRCRDGSYRWTESRSRVDDSGNERLVVSAVRDISERRESDLDLQRQVDTDPLTGLANRSVLMDRLRHALRRLERHGGVVAVLFLDLDRFKVVNDALGHHAGDAVLAQLAQRLLHVIRPQDTLARLGGDEFAIVAEDLLDQDDALALGARIIAAGRQPFVVDGERFVCTTSAGIAVTTDAGQSAEGLLREADLALYRAKDRGRDRADVFDEDLRAHADGRLGTERMLRRAVAEDRLRIHFQPIIELSSGSTVTAEAFARVWDPEQPELIAAGVFLDVAEESGLLAAIDEWMLARVIEQAACWRDRLPGASFGDIAINVTARHLADADFARSVIDDLAAQGLQPSVLQVEVTERVLMEASNSAMSGLETLRAAGVRIGLDDFGTGYSSLAYLRMFPLDFVKIDRSLIARLDCEDAEGAIVAALIDLSHALGMFVVAEGVETKTQAQQLQRLGCDRAQGFHFGHAGPAEAIEPQVLATR